MPQDIAERVVHEALEEANRLYQSDIDVLEPYLGMAAESVGWRFFGSFYGKDKDPEAIFMREGEGYRLYIAGDRIGISFGEEKLEDGLDEYTTNCILDYIDEIIDKMSFEKIKGGAANG